MNVEGGWNTRAQSFMNKQGVRGKGNEGTEKVITKMKGLWEKYVKTYDPTTHVKNTIIGE